MSLSQKHSGKALVPWYNNTEWLFVYDCLRKNDKQSLETALNVMKIWKQRVPFLSAGVEGTLIVLDGILNEEKSEIYALTLLRFLNLCAANNERQGYFTRTAQKGDIPKWLIEIRHDIAHSHKLPSKTMLELSLQKALDWVMNKYWKAQHDIVKDYVINDEKNERLEELLTAYVRLKVNKFGGKSTHDFDAALSEKIKYFLGRHGQNTNMGGVIEVLEEMLRQSLKNEVASKITTRILVQKNALLYSDDKEFMKIWNNLLNIILERKMLISLLFKLYFATDEAEWNNVEKNCAAVWINAIFQGLLNLKNENGSKYDNIVFKRDLLQDFNSKLLLETVISSPNDYTLIYLENLMKFNEQSEDYITEVSNLIKTATIPSSNQQLQENLDFTLELSEEFKKIEKITSAATEIVGNPLSNDEMHWTPVTDKESFIGCPLGVLPYQIRNKNPSLLV